MNEVSLPRKRLKKTNELIQGHGPYEDYRVTVFDRYDYDKNSYDANDDEIQAASVDHNKIVSQTSDAET